MGFCVYNLWRRGYLIYLFNRFLLIIILMLRYGFECWEESGINVDKSFVFMELVFFLVCVKEVEKLNKINE